MSHAQRFPLRIDGLRKVLRHVPNLGPAVVIDGGTVTLDAMGFHTTFPAASVTAAEPKAKLRDVGMTPRTRGTHGYAGRWVVNGSAQGLVSVTVDPGVRGWLFGFPLRVRRLTVSVEDPAAFIAALNPPTPRPSGPALG